MRQNLWQKRAVSEGFTDACGATIYHKGLILVCYDPGYPKLAVFYGTKQ